MNQDFFGFKDYKKLLNHRIAQFPKAGRGIKAALANAMHVQSAYLSRVLNGSADLSLEQVDSANQFFNHSNDESRFLLLLVEQNRAATPSLKKHFEREIARLLRERERVNVGKETKAGLMLSVEDQLTYYSSWQYSAIHIALSVPKLQNKVALAAELKIPIEAVNYILDFLIRTKMAVQKNGRFEIGNVWIHLPPESVLASKAHSNWRLRAIDSIERSQRNNFHYTQVVSLSNEDAKILLNLMGEFVDQSNTRIRASKEEVVRCLSLDFFSVSNY
jgi:uncharacterized protein (TIGR02147 family)